MSSKYFADSLPESVELDRPIKCESRFARFGAGWPAMKDRLAARARDERGSVSIFTVVIAIAMLAAAGLAYDGSQKLGALSAARDIADNAARTCAQGIDEAALRRSASPALDPVLASARAQAYLATTGGATGSAVVTDTSCTVTVSIDVPSVFIPMGGPVSATESADALFGIEAPT